jgi:hypothetical protein
MKQFTTIDINERIEGKRLSVYMRKDLVEYAQVEAKRDNRSLSNWLTQLVENHWLESRG